MPFIYDDPTSATPEPLAQPPLAHPPQTMTKLASETLMSWADLQELGNRAPFGCRNPASITSNPALSIVHDCIQTFEYQHPGGPNLFGYGNQCPSSTYTANPERLSLQNQLSPAQYGTQPRHGLSWPAESSQWQHVGDISDPSVLTNTALSSRPQTPDDFTYFTANSRESSVYSSSPPQDFRGLHYGIDDILTPEGRETERYEPPYAQLIYDALMDAPEHKLVLKDIYTWIGENTDKAKDPNFKGWQNSVRHNLSMNGAFKKEPYRDPLNEHKKGFIWVLEPFAVGKGIESTTRYRQKTAVRRSDSIGSVDRKRQKSGEKGGKAARRSTRLKQSANLYRNNIHRSPYSGVRSYDASLTSSPANSSGPSSPDLSLYNRSSVPYYVNTPVSQSPPPEMSPYYVNTPVSQTPPPNMSLYNHGGFNDNTMDNYFELDGAFLGSERDDTFDGPIFTASP